jgi:hypothetical protein
MGCWWKKDKYYKRGVRNMSLSYSYKIFYDAPVFYMKVNPKDAGLI